MKYLFLILMIFLCQYSFSQKFDVEFLERLTKISFVSIDEYMIEGYGFEKVEEENNGRQRTFIRTYNENWDNLILIEISSPKDKPNILDIRVGKNYNIRSIKDNIISSDYEYDGTNKLGFAVYKKDKSTFIISKEPNEAGATQIMLISGF